MNDNDHRVKSKGQMIKETLLYLLKTMELKDITIRLLCEKSEVSENTFYSYYTAPFDVLIEIGKDYIAELKQQLNEYDSSMNAREYLEWICLYLSHHSEIPKTIVKSGVGHCFVDDTKEIYQKMLCKSGLPRVNDPSVDKIWMVDSFLHSGAYSTILHWVVSDNKKSSTEMANSVLQVICDVRLAYTTEKPKRGYMP